MKKRVTRRQQSTPKANETIYRRQDHIRSSMWALLEVCSFLIVYFISILTAQDGILPFAYGFGAMSCVIACEAVLKKRLWIFEPLYQDSIGHPEMPIRLATFVSGIVLVLEIAYLAVVTAKY